MKRIRGFVAVIAMAMLCFTGCNSVAEPAQEHTMQEESVAEEQKTEAEASEKVAEENSVAEESEDAAKEVTEDNVKPEGPQLTFIGHAAVKIVAEDGSVLYVDPNYAMGDYSDAADVVLVTHGHSDHRPIKSLPTKDNYEKITYQEALVDGEYKSFEVGPFVIQAVAAGGNENHDISECVGYLITVDGITVYHAGDTSKIDQMSELSDRKIDYAMYPIDGKYNMDAIEATEAANLVGATHNIPIHDYNSGDERKQENFTPEGRLELAYGETITMVSE
ncbi:MAG: MBL fold metallo-hydrolase [bacterium]|nr:MBL fold metallo-hydrolase [bacterium]